MIPLPPDPSSARLVVEPPAPGYGNWAGAPSAVCADGWVYRTGDEWLAFYDGRATADANAEERTWLASGPLPYGLVAAPGGPAFSSPWGSGSLRYVSVADGRLYFEASLADGSHGLFAQPD